jgi:hypothetical protein
VEHGLPATRRAAVKPVSLLGRVPALIRKGGAVAGSEDIKTRFEIQPLAIPIYVEGRIRRRRDSRSGDEVRGYALAIGWHPFEPVGRGGFEGEPPEILYLVADPRRPQPTWVPESAVVKHFRTFLSGVPEPNGATAAEPPAL